MADKISRGTILRRCILEVGAARKAANAARFNKSPSTLSNRDKPVFRRPRPLPTDTEWNRYVAAMTGQQLNDVYHAWLNNFIDGFLLSGDVSTLTSTRTHCAIILMRILEADVTVVHALMFCLNTSPSVGVQIIAICMSVCLSAENSSPNFTHFYTCYLWPWLGLPLTAVLPVLWMTPCFHVMERMGQNERRRVCFFQ